jgi:3-oxoacyl-[acyl-carrier protein] reductase
MQVSAEQAGMDSPLNGQCALITGAASGIGLAAAAALSAAGAMVIGLDLNDTTRGLEVLKADVTSEDDIARAVGLAAAKLGGLDIVVNSAGIALDAPLNALAVADLDRMYAVNLRGPLLVVRACLPHLRSGARVINIASELAYVGRAGASAYCATKGGVVSLTRALARELAPRVLVNAIAPGPTDTPFLQFASLPLQLQQMELSNPLGRIGRPEEIAAAIVFLASPRASFITGHCLNVDGGAAMH